MALPIRPKLLNDKFDPRCMKSKTDSPELSLTMPYRDIEEPALTKDRRRALLPRHMKSNTEKFDPKDVTP
jgi:hypothetical protein